MNTAIERNVVKRSVTVCPRTKLIHFTQLTDLLVDLLGEQLGFQLIS